MLNKYVVILIIVFFNIIALSKADSTNVKCTIIDRSIKLWRTSDTISTTVDESIDENQFVFAYPNPSNDFIEFSFLTNIGKVLKVCIEDINGRNIKIFDLNYIDNNTIIKWDFQKENSNIISSGTYFIKVQSLSKIYIQKIVISR